ncbi:MAG: phosphate signaling complex protein PhoU [Anaerolineae bacterium]|jgi:phosphate transport system protein|nr:phosphate signaling complex protein PhoU [Chloroflexota bacterium]
MTRTTLDRELQRLQDEMSLMGSIVSRALGESVEVLRAQDGAAAERLMSADDAIDQQRYAIESDVLILIARHQPMATDLRALAAILEIVGDLERIGDYAKGIAKVTLMMGGAVPLPPLPELPLMAAKARSMLSRALEAFLRQDAEAARAIPQEDDEVDALYNQVNAAMIEMIIADPSRMDQSNYITWAAHNLERAADRVTNICERAVFTVTGDMQELDAS